MADDREHQRQPIQAGEGIAKRIHVSDNYYREI